MCNLFTGTIFEDWFTPKDNRKKYEEGLNKFYCKDMENYFRVLNNAKIEGYRVFRDKDGKHKVVNK